MSTKKDATTLEQDVANLVAYTRRLFSRKANIDLVRAQNPLNPEKWEDALKKLIHEAREYSRLATQMLMEYRRQNVVNIVSLEDADRALQNLASSLANEFIQDVDCPLPTAIPSIATPYKAEDRVIDKILDTWALDTSDEKLSDDKRIKVERERVRIMTVHGPNHAELDHIVARLATKWKSRVVKDERKMKLSQEAKERPRQITVLRLDASKIAGKQSFGTVLDSMLNCGEQDAVRSGAESESVSLIWIPNADEILRTDARASELIPRLAMDNLLTQYPHVRVVMTTNMPWKMALSVQKASQKNIFVHLSGTVRRLEIFIDELKKHKLNADDLDSIKELFNLRTSPNPNGVCAISKLMNWNKTAVENNWFGGFAMSEAYDSADAENVVQANGQLLFGYSAEDVRQLVANVHHKVKADAYHDQLKEAANTLYENRDTPNFKLQNVPQYDEVLSTPHEKQYARMSENEIHAWVEREKKLIEEQKKLGKFNESVFALSSTKAVQLVVMRAAMMRAVRAAYVAYMSKSDAEKKGYDLSEAKQPIFTREQLETAFHMYMTKWNEFEAKPIIEDTRYGYEESYLRNLWFAANGSLAYPMSSRQTKAEVAECAADFANPAVVHGHVARHTRFGVHDQ